MIFEALAVVTAVSVVVWTLLPMLRNDAWWIRAFEFPRVQVTLLSCLVLAAWFAVRGWHGALDKLAIAALLVCIVFQLVRIFRYMPVAPKQLQSVDGSSPQDMLTVLVANVLTPNRDAAALLRLIRERAPDLVLALETDAWWQEQLDTLQSDYPYSVKHPLDNLYGMHLYSRLELVDAEVKFLVEEDVPSVHADVVLRSGERVELHCLHPAPPSPTENQTSAERDGELLVVAKSLQSRRRPVVVMGDLNDVPWSAASRLFRDVSGLLDPRIGRGLYCTFHAKYPFLRWPLDHVFCSRDFTLVSIARLGTIGSDHFPLLVALRLSPVARRRQQGPEADPAEEQRAQEKIDKVDADRPGRDRADPRDPAATDQPRDARS